MEALILAAGLGTRLRPLTDSRPKALVEINGKTLLEIAIGRVADAGVKRCVVNAHYFGDMLIHFIQQHRWPCEVLVSDEREMLLNTGGALKHAAPLFSGDEPVLIHNVDILSDIDFLALQQHHLESGNLVTLCTSHRETTRMLLFDREGHLAGIHGQTEASGLTPLPFSGVSMVSPQLFPLMPSDDHPYPVFGCYLELAKHYPIGYFMHSADRWLDVGTPQAVERAKTMF
ncbi:MAG: nucleotidyltransferase family protein [Bacteroidales bacterium]|nr:nucleotidyltransferase family protein [Bacteroidales bacterium]